MQTGGPRHDLARFGMERASPPRQADLMIVAGRVSQKMAPVLRQIYDQMAEPKWVIAMGVCASSGGMFNNYAIVHVDHVVPVDIYLPGCPPRPEMLLDAIVKLHDKIHEHEIGRAPPAGGDRTGGGPAAPPAAGPRPGRQPVTNRRGHRPGLCGHPGPALTGGAVTEPRPDVGARAGTGRSAGLRNPPKRNLPKHGLPKHGLPKHGLPKHGLPKHGRRRRVRPMSENTPPAGGVPAETEPDEAALAGQQRLGEQVVRTGMFGTQTTGDTSGYGGLQVRRPPLPSTPRPYGSYFDEIADALSTRLEDGGSGFGEAIERVVVDRGQLTLHVRREYLVEVARLLRDEPSLAFELCNGVSGVHYPGDAGRELHAVYGLLSITHNRRLRLEVSAPDADPHIPSVVDVYPTCDWHERETWDFFGIIFDGHPALTRIEMPDDWKGHPQRKDYPLGGIPVEYRGATVPPPDERRSYT